MTVLSELPIEILEMILEELAHHQLMGMKFLSHTLKNAVHSCLSRPQYCRREIDRAFESLWFFLYDESGPDDVYKVLELPDLWRLPLLYTHPGDKRCRAYRGLALGRMNLVCALQAQYEHLLEAGKWRHNVIIMKEASRIAQLLELPPYWKDTTDEILDSFDGPADADMIEGEWNGPICELDFEFRRCLPPEYLPYNRTRVRIHKRTTWLINRLQSRTPQRIVDDRGMIREQAKVNPDNVTLAPSRIPADQWRLFLQSRANMTCPCRSVCISQRREACTLEKCNNVISNVL